MSKTVTVVFEGDVSTIGGNPFKVECPFGKVVAISVSDEIAENESLRAAVERIYQSSAEDHVIEIAEAALSGDKHE